MDFTEKSASMIKPVIISIKGLQSSIDDCKDNNSIEMITSGSYIRKDDGYYITYKETEVTGLDGMTTTVHVEGKDKVTLFRAGPMDTHLVFERGMRHLNHYATGFGDLIVGVSAKNIDCNLNDDGGSISVSYVMEVNSTVTSENQFFINIKETQFTDDKSFPIS